MQGQGPLARSTNCVAIGVGVTILLLLVASVISPDFVSWFIQTLSSGLGAVAYDLAHGFANLLRTWGSPRG